MKKYTLYIIVLFFLFACGRKAKTESNEMLVFCAASLTNVITELAEKYEMENEVDFQLNFASSGTLARQIEHGAEPSVYISANEKWVDYLIQLNLLASETKLEVAGNSLAAIVPLDSPLDSISFQTDFPNVFKGRLAMGDPKHVPAGDYAQQAINNAGYANELKDRILPTKDVRSALMVVELGEVEMGIVYKTDALKSKKVKIVSEIPAALHAPIGFYAAVLKKKNNAQSLRFYEYLSSPEAKVIWIKHGFKFE
ncbi:molybdate ABC transporter substrate-binding protein [Prolixibacteraceae bacterium Z1-6]|uniref:Molybdate ABC transporter substrate-binding protein n=1 Tax=Draconibacterium aestuarii TaxID=2998507 RepID=A0A9X3FAA4_9BACT|nr:molybdate ABC transporter substrate-binding protein [Prolixibacteraceae bacterium Z1-6]